jgi:Cell wall-active antibiotics response 4TMS YvqF/Domain of unknown function (DUF5668)
MPTNHRHWPGLLPGLLLVSVGGGLLAREFGLLPAHVRLVDFWPLILLFVGVSSLLRARGFMGALFALAFVATGAVLLASNLGFLVFPAARLWPGLLVLLGIAFLIRSARGSNDPGPANPGQAPDDDDFDHDAPDDGATAAHGGVTTADDRINKQVMFSGLEFKVESQAWKGGELGVTAGGVEIDLRNARLDPEGALLDVRILMGGVDIRVPDTWQVRNDVIPLLGGADDSTRSTQGSTGAPLLRIVGSVTLGGISIHN